MPGSALAASSLQPNWLSECAVRRHVPDFEANPLFPLQVRFDRQRAFAERLSIRQLDPLPVDFFSVATDDFRESQRESPLDRRT